MDFRIPAQEEMLAALGRAWWNGLYLGGQMIDVAAALGVIAPLNHLTLGQLRQEMLAAVPRAGLSVQDRDRVRQWLDDLADVIDKRNDLGHAQPYTVGPDGSGGWVQGLLRVRKGSPPATVNMPTPDEVLTLAADLEAAAIAGNELYYDLWPD